MAADGITLKATNTPNTLATADEEVGIDSVGCKEVGIDSVIEEWTLRETQIRSDLLEDQRRRDGAEQDGFLDCQDLARLGQASWKSYRNAAVLIAANAKRWSA